jgi:pimeloyl-ACP methyl ester carboxylesterase
MSTIPQRSKTRRGSAYVEVGSGEPLVLIHGVGMRLEAWAPQIAALQKTHRVIAVDMPGHGASERIPSSSTLADFVAWLGALLDELAIRQANVAGHSMGALIAGGAAATFGDTIGRVALLNAVYKRDPVARDAVMQRAAQIESGDIDPTGPLKRWFSEEETDGEAYRLTDSWLSEVDPQGYATAYSAFAGGDATYADAWPRISCPALFLTGEDDPNSTAEMTVAMAKAAPHGVAKVIAGHRHMVNMTAPDAVNEALSQWLAREVVPS